VTLQRRNRCIFPVFFRADGDDCSEFGVALADGTALPILPRHIGEFPLPAL